MPRNEALLKHCTQRSQVLQRQRQSWEPEARELSRFVNPHRGQFFKQPNQSRGQQTNQSVLDPTAMFALRTLVAGFMGGLTSPARPWFRLTVPDKDVASQAPVRAWLDDCADRMRMVFNSGNTYQVLPILYEELGQFGVGASIVEFDREDVLRLYQMSFGEYWLGINHRGTVDTLKRDFMYSHRQIVQRWGKEARPESYAKRDEQDFDSEIKVCHLIEPNADYNPERWDSGGKPWRSVYWAHGASNGDYIALGGYSGWPVLSPRWKPIGNDAYSKGPGHDGLPDTKSLQVFTKRLHNAIDKHVNPPMGAHISLRGSASSVLPGAMNYFTTAEKGAGMWPLYQPAPTSIAEVRSQIQDTRQTINKAFFADIFLMISDMEGVQPRNQLELQLRKEEKMLMLGPVLESLHDELLQPLISRAFDIMFENRLFLPPPQEMHGLPLDIELVSVLAQAQKAASLGSIERLFAFVGSIAGAKPEALDKLDADTGIDTYADSIGVPAGIVVGNDEVKKMREARAKAQATQQAMTTAGQLADTAKTMSETEVGAGRNALQTVTGL